MQVHTSMSRGIQAFSTQEEGDTLFAASAQEVEYRDPGGVTMGAIASEIMWDAIQASVQEQQPFAPSAMPPNPGVGRSVRLRLQRKDLMPLDIVVAPAQQSHPPGSALRWVCS